MSQLLEKNKLPHQLLNAKQHANEADIITQAGRPKMITIATNMAGRGTDIVLGGNPEPEIEKISSDEKISEAIRTERITKIREEWQVVHDEVLKLGGLHIIGTERHESRRVDNQLRGRSGRQGDPGSSRFYLSLEDSLLRIFASDRVASIMDRLKMPEGEAIEHPWVTRAIENAQRKVEARNFDMRKQLLEYDDVSNDQRKVLYQLRNDLLETDNCYEFIEEIRSEVLDGLVSFYMPLGSAEEQWDVPGLEKTLVSEYQLQLPIHEWLDKEPELNEETLGERVSEAASQQYQNKVDLVGEDVMRQYERAVLLQTLDSHWREHLAALDHLRQGIHLRGYAQKNPKQEYKREAYDLFQAMMGEIKSEVTQILMMVQIRDEKQMEAASEMPQSHVNMQYQHASYEGLGEGEGEGEEANNNSKEETHQPFVRQGGKVGRNDPCPCGSGKKYKQCCGKLS